ncbi:hypothetical protein QAD02_013039 [Eretmocerus hayati]|uniref:Uncharacterized protein n=1 Tax=Eretmocerus hayati TaxID=131215 RepID=A0ACC2P1I6_9HYME|nr:hypothetical protein QAD02_013039 [Eretmocerus hayati]
MAFLHTQSSECLKLELDIFEIPPTQTTLESSHYVQYKPISSLTDDSSIEFVLSGNGDEYIDLAHTLLSLKVSLQAPENDDYDAATVSALGKEKLGLPLDEDVSFVLESDGTQIEDGEYFKSLPNNTTLVVLRHGEEWCPAGIDIIRAAISAIPKIVCETIHALELHDETPSWKIMDNKGRVTVVLHWDQRSNPSASGFQSKNSEIPMNVKTSFNKKKSFPPAVRPMFINQSNSEITSKPGDISEQRHVNPQITVISHDDLPSATVSTTKIDTNRAFNTQLRLTEQESGSFEGMNVHLHSLECSSHIHPLVIRDGSPIDLIDIRATRECDFHCCTLHEEGRRIAVRKSVATSPIQDALLSNTSKSPQMSSALPLRQISDSSRRQGIPKGHVRFQDIVIEDDLRSNPQSSHAVIQRSSRHYDSSESETENTMMDDEVVTTEKFLLLIDQLTAEQKQHLSIKDIGIILERLHSKILDVERLDRESESSDCFNWTIKAIIRGDILRELGVIYNGNYYAISEHPGYKEESEDNNEDDDEGEDKL